MTLECGSDSRIAIGVLVGGKYRLLQRIGTGGMGHVYSAMHTQLRERVALKFLDKEYSTNQEALARFRREAQAAVRLRSEHVARILDVGAHDTLTPYIVMEYLEGENLSDYLSSRGTIAIGEALSYVLQACEAVAEAHGLGIVHRDLKLANLFRTVGPDKQPCIKVLDFGISKLLDDGALAPSIALTSNDTILGSPLYMSPEQLLAPRTVDVRTDVWSIGVILYELLTGTSPFQGENITEICANVATRDPRSISELRPEIPEWLERVIHKCLAKDRDQRFASLAELGGVLLPFADAYAIASLEKIIRMRNPVETPVINPSHAQRPLDVPQGSSDTSITLSRFVSRRLPSTAVGFAATLVLLGGTAGYYIVGAWSKELPSARALLQTNPSHATVTAEAPSSTVVAPQVPEHVASGHEDLKHHAPETPNVSDRMPLNNSVSSTSPSLPLRARAQSRPVPTFTTQRSRTEVVEKTTHGTSTHPFVTIQERWKGRL